MDKPAGTPFDPAVVSQVAGGYKLTVNFEHPYGWFGPGAPMTPMAPPYVEPRRFDYPTGVNLGVTPRRDTASGVTFEQMRALSDGYDLLRLVVETRKDQIEALDWVVRPRLKKGQTPTPAEVTRAEAAEKILHSPDRQHTWSQWLRMSVEEMLVTDALAIYPRPTRGGGVYSLDLLDGATIKPLIDDTGRSPLPPLPAYQQSLKGMPAVNFTRDELLYAVTNPRVHKIYGFSPVEQIITTVNLALRRQVTQLHYYTEGNVPEALMSVPAGWTVAQLREYQDHWDTMMIGDMAQRRRIRFVPDGAKYVPTREPVIKDAFDEWLARIVCFAFSISPTPFVAQVNRAVAESSLQQAAAEGLKPLMKRIKSVIDQCLVWLGFADIEFFWADDEDERPLETAQIHEIYVRSGILEKDEVRADLNRAPLPNGMGRMKPAPEAPAQTGSNGLPGFRQKTPPDDDQGDEGDGEEEDEPVAKAALIIKPKKKTASVIARPSARMTKAVKAILGQKAERVAAQAASRLGKVTKAEGPEDDRGRADGFVESFDFGSWRDLQEIVHDYVAEMVEESARDAVVALGARVSPDAYADIVKVIPKDAIRIAKDRAAELVKDISDTTRDMLRSTVAEALEQGWSSDKLAEQIRSSTAFSEERAVTIARTELAEAHSQGTRQGWKASGQVQKKGWLLGSDSCEICQENADQGDIDFDTPFASGHQVPPAHPNCTCDNYAVLKPLDEAEP